MDKIDFGILNKLYDTAFASSMRFSIHYIGKNRWFVFINSTKEYKEWVGEQKRFEDAVNDALEWLKGAENGR